MTNGGLGVPAGGSMGACRLASCWVRLASIYEGGLPMRYVIYGAGAIGASVGAKLHMNGIEVALIARGAHLKALQTDGLTLIHPDGDGEAEDAGLRTPVRNRMAPR